MFRRVLMAGLTASSLAAKSSVAAASRGVSASISISSTTTGSSTTGSSSSSSSTTTPTTKPGSTISRAKILYVVRHGQAVHNPRAEAAKERGCSMEEFFRLMREDDALDADLTDLGRDQARRCREAHFLAPNDKDNDKDKDKDNGIDDDETREQPPNPLGIDLVVASCLSRTIDTADLVFPPHGVLGGQNDGDGDSDGNNNNNNNNSNRHRAPPRVSIEDFREVNGNLLNGKRRTKSELLERHPHWNFDSLVTEEDETWTQEMEDFGDAAERGYRGLVGLLEMDNAGRGCGGDNDSDNDNSIRTILLVCHGGILRYLMNIHPLVELRDERGSNNGEGEGDTESDKKAVGSRFDNCELRKYRLSWSDGDIDIDGDERERSSERRGIVLTQLDH